MGVKKATPRRGSRTVPKKKTKRNSVMHNLTRFKMQEAGLRSRMGRPGATARTTRTMTYEEAEFILRERPWRLIDIKLKELKADQLDGYEQLCNALRKEMSAKGGVFAFEIPRSISDLINGKLLWVIVFVFSLILNLYTVADSLDKAIITSDSYLFSACSDHQWHTCFTIVLALYECTVVSVGVLFGILGLVFAVVASIYGHISLLGEGSKWLDMEKRANLRIAAGKVGAPGHTIVNVLKNAGDGFTLAQEFSAFKIIGELYGGETLLRGFMKMKTALQAYKLQLDGMYHLQDEDERRKQLTADFDFSAMSHSHAQQGFSFIQLLRFLRKKSETSYFYRVVGLPLVFTVYFLYVVVLPLLVISVVFIVIPLGIVGLYIKLRSISVLFVPAVSNSTSAQSALQLNDEGGISDWGSSEWHVVASVSHGV